MYRRLYFLFPSSREARKAVDELEEDEHLQQIHLHALARDGVDLGGLPRATEYQRRDIRAIVSKAFWGSELGIFTAALLAFIISLYFGFSIWSVIALTVMAVTLVSGAWFAMRVPDTTLEEFEGSLAHDELLLMVDVPKARMEAIERRIQEHHPAAVFGGSSWTVEYFGI